MAKGKKGPRPEEPEAVKCDGQHPAPICGAQDCHRDEIAAAEHTATCADPECSRPGCVLKRAEVDVRAAGTTSDDDPEQDTDGHADDEPEEGDDEDDDLDDNADDDEPAPNAKAPEQKLPRTVEQIGVNAQGERIVATKAPCRLTAEERTAKAETWAEASRTLERLEGDKSRSMSDYNALLKAQRKTVHDLRTQFETSTETRQVSCREVPIYERSVFEIRRLDTDELIDTRAMSESERTERQRLLQAEQVAIRVEDQQPKGDAPEPEAEATVQEQQPDEAHA